MLLCTYCEGVTDYLVLMCWGGFFGSAGNFSHFISCVEIHNYMSVICKANSPSLSVFDTGCLTTWLIKTRLYC